MTPARLALNQLRDLEDDVRSVPTELVALAQLMRLSAEHEEPLSKDETRGVCDLLHLVAGQARNAVKAFDLAFDLLSLAHAPGRPARETYRPPG